MRARPARHVLGRSAFRTQYKIALVPARRRRRRRYFFILGFFTLGLTRFAQRGTRPGAAGS